MHDPAQELRPRRRHSKLRHDIRRRWVDIMVGIVFVAACLIALLLLLDVIDTTIGKPDRPGAAAPQ